MRKFLGLSTFLVATTALSGQSAYVEARSALTHSQANVMTEQNGNCPVNLEATRSSANGLLQVKPGEPRRHGQELYLSLRPAKVNAIVQATVTVYGTSGPHVSRAGNDARPVGSATSAEMSEDFTISPRVEEKTRFTSVVYPVKITNVTFVELKALTYADGTEWHRSASSTCRVAPNGFKLVAEGN